MKKVWPFFLLLAAIIILGLVVNKPKTTSSPQVLVLPSATPSPTPTPTPKPLTFAEMNARYGPCVRLPVLMYHHVQEMDLAKEKNQTGLSVSPEFFQNQMKYLKDKGYQTASMNDLALFFDSQIAVSPKSVLLTFDDAYDDFATSALPTIREFGFKATVFTPTGLLNNPGYLSWSMVTDISGRGDILFGNHTWSHHNLLAAAEVITKEITTADVQLGEKGLNNPKVFAYPYGLASSGAEKVLTELGYKLAFTTMPGSTLCKQKRLELPRIRIGNTSLSSYGF